MAEPSKGPPKGMGAEEAYAKGWRRYSEFKWWGRIIWKLCRSLQRLATGPGMTHTWEKENPDA